MTKTITAKQNREKISSFWRHSQKKRRNYILWSSLFRVLTLTEMLWHDHMSKNSWNKTALWRQMTLIHSCRNHVAVLSVIKLINITQFQITYLNPHSALNIYSVWYETINRLYLLLCRKQVFILFPLTLNQCLEVGFQNRDIMKRN